LTESFPRGLGVKIPRGLGVPFHLTSSGRTLRSVVSGVLAFLCRPIPLGTSGFRHQRNVKSFDFPG
ncbi:hypothetical protein, partial [Planktothricoides raciborskii]|uniref:hypothetical protein n=1 Tax=Planktothricoides raciborskii TaxID=132608 RepID=UPI001A7E69BB